LCAAEKVPIWVYILIPVLSALVGYATNVIAIWMTFWPTEFRPIKIWQAEGQPIGLIGWQGIIPAKAVYMVQKLCDVFVEKVLDVDAIFRRVDPKHVASLTKGQLQVSSHTLLEPESLRCIRNERPFWCLIICFKNGLLIRTHGVVFCTSSTFDVDDIIAVSCITQRPERAHVMIQGSKAAQKHACRASTHRRQINGPARNGLIS
jgi:hypothetical protein